MNKKRVDFSSDFNLSDLIDNLNELKTMYGDVKTYFDFEIDKPIELIYAVNWVQYIFFDYDEKK